MLHGISFIPVDNTALQEAIASNLPKDRISYLKQAVSYDAVYGFEYDEVSFEQLGNILSNDYGFSPFKYKTKEEGAVYDVDKHPHAYGRIRGRNNVNDTISWLCLDIDDTTITDEEMHQVLGKMNHHISRTSNKNNPYKYRILLPLSQKITISNDLWKPFTRSVASYLGTKTDLLGRSQVFYGYEGRTVLSITDKADLDPSTHLEVARMKVAEIEEKRANAMPKGEADKRLQRPYQEFEFAYEAQDGEGSTKLLAAIHHAKELGADRDYIIGLVHSINNFWDHPMPAHRLQSTIMSAI